MTSLEKQVVDLLNTHFEAAKAAALQKARSGALDLDSFPQGSIVAAKLVVTSALRESTEIVAPLYVNFDEELNNLSHF